MFTISRKEGQVLNPRNPYHLWSSWRMRPRGDGEEVREEREDLEKAGAQKPQGRGTWRRRKWMVSSVTGRMSQMMKTEETVE